MMKRFGYTLMEKNIKKKNGGFKNMMYLYEYDGVVVEMELTESDFYNEGYDE